MNYMTKQSNVPEVSLGAKREHPSWLDENAPAVQQANKKFKIIMQDSSSSSGGLAVSAGTEEANNENQNA